MNWDAIGALGEVVGATAVVVSLVYLALQIRRQSDDARYSAMHDIAVGFRDAIDKAGDRDFTDIAIAGLKDFDSLTEAEKLSMLSRMINIFRVCEEAYILKRDGRLDDRYWRGIEAYLSSALSAPGTQRIWCMRKHYFDESFQLFVDNLEHTSWQLE